MVLHSTHRTLSPFVNQLKNEFRVTLFFQRTKLHNETNADVSGFHFVRFAPEELTDNMLYTELSWIRQQAFDIIFFPEVLSPVVTFAFNVQPV